MCRRLLVAVASACAIGLVGLIAPKLVFADDPPELLDVRLNDENHAVVTWTKEPWQRSASVRWSTGNGAFIDIDTPNWDSHYGWPIADCDSDPKGPPVDGVYPYGQQCHGQDVQDADATTATMNVPLSVGTYYFQVIVFGQNNFYGNPPCSLEAGEAECGSPHWSDVFKLIVLPPGGGSGPDSSDGAGPGESGEPNGGSGETRCDDPTQECAFADIPRDIEGPANIDLPGGGELDVDDGARVQINPPWNINVEAGSIHLSEDLAIFDCPSWMQPEPDATTLIEWVGVRCRTITTPQGAAMVEGTEFTVTVDDTYATFRVFRGQIGLCDLYGNGATTVGPGEVSRIARGYLPSQPVSFDPSDPKLRWWDRPSAAQIAALVAAGTAATLFLIAGYLLPTILAVVQRRRRVGVIAAIDVLTGWTLVGWFASLWLVSRPDDPAPNRPAPPGQPPQPRFDSSTGLPLTGRDEPTA
jgi:hypothetical protein